MTIPRIRGWINRAEDRPVYFSVFQLEKCAEGKRGPHFPILFVQEVLEHFLLVDMDPVVVI
jgi:hypothetical protein